MPIRIAHALNVAALFALSAVLGYAFYDQFVRADLPCPLCILQRAAFAAVGIGIALNVLHGPSSRNYGLAILAAVAGAAVALRQIALHVVPGTGAYGSPLFGLHFYTWAFVAFGLVLLGCGATLVAHRDGPTPARRGVVATAAVALFLALVAGNAISTLAECGTGLCPDDPVAYQGLDDVLRRSGAGPTAAP